MWSALTSTTYFDFTGITCRSRPDQRLVPAGASPVKPAPPTIGASFDVRGGLVGDPRAADVIELACASRLKATGGSAPPVSVGSAAIRCHHSEVHRTSARPYRRLARALFAPRAGDDEVRLNNTLGLSRRLPPALRAQLPGRARSTNLLLPVDANPQSVASRPARQVPNVVAVVILGESDWPLWLGERVAAMPERVVARVAGVEGGEQRQEQGRRAARPGSRLMAAAERDVWAAAAILVRRYGADAASEAGRRADELLADSDMEGQREWMPIRRAIEELQRAERREGEAVN
jgi:hypothetical protein